MKLWAIAFTRKGAALCACLTAELEKLGHEVRAFCKGDYDLPPLTQAPPLSQWAREAFLHADGILFVGACGIAVRAIAPYVKSKTQDPAVVVVDELGKFSISLLSGHMGGANRLCLQVAAAAGAVPVITTATDVNGLFSVDVFAKEHNLVIGSMAAAKAVSAALLDGKPVLLDCDSRFLGLFPTNLPEGIALGASGPLGICVSLDGTQKPFDTTLNLIPKQITVGIGCRKGVSAAMIEGAVNGALAQAGISPEAVAQVCSIDLKADEPGILEFCTKNSLPFNTYSAETLLTAPGEFTLSEFVRGVTGVDNVCERAAALGGGTLLLKKTIFPSVTIALAVQIKTSRLAAKG